MDTIEIVGGVHAGTKRLQLKSVLERYGEIDICHKALVIPNKSKLRLHGNHA